MNDTGAPNSDYEPEKRRNPDWVVRSLQNIKRDLQQRRAEKAKESPGDKASRRTANATVFIAILTAVLAGVGVAQWMITSGTLDEMRNEQRPWIYADIGSGGKIFRNQSGGLTIQVGFKFHNTGHLPAFYVSPDVDGYLSSENETTSVRERQKRRCGGQIQQPKATDQVGVTVFPGQDVGFGVGVGIDSSSIESTKMFWKQRSGKELDVLSPWIVGCIRYRSPDGGYHQTGIALSVSMIKPGKEGLFGLPIDPTGIDAGNIIMSPWVEGGTAYAN